MPTPASRAALLMVNPFIALTFVQPNYGVRTIVRKQGRTTVGIQNLNGAALSDAACVALVWPAVTRAAQKAKAPHFGAGLFFARRGWARAGLIDVDRGE